MFVVAKLLVFIAKPLLRFDAIVEFTAKRDLFNPLAGFDDKRIEEVPPTVRFATLVTARFIEVNFEMTAGRPILIVDEFERDDVAESLLTATGSFRARFTEGKVGVTTRAVKRG